jgi:hypothetical protein
MDGVDFRLISLGIVTALAKEEFVFSLDSFMANLNNPKKSEEEEEEGLLRQGFITIVCLFILYVKNKRKRKKERRYILPNNKRGLEGGQKKSLC